MGRTVSIISRTNVASVGSAFKSTQNVRTRYSGEASPTFGHANANFSVFIDRIRNQFLKK